MILRMMITSDLPRSLSGQRALPPQKKSPYFSIKKPLRFIALTVKRIICILFLFLQIIKEAWVFPGFLHLFVGDSLLERMAVHHISIVISTMIAAEINLDACAGNISGTFWTVLECFVSLFERFLGSVERSRFPTVEI